MASKERPIATRLVSYFKKNPSSIFFVLFVIMIIASMSMLSSDRPVHANDIAAYAYCMLVINTAFKLMSLLKNF